MEKKEESEIKLSEVLNAFFLGEFTFDELKYVPQNLGTDDSKELADAVIDLGKTLIAFQVKGRHGVPKPDGDVKWVDSHISDAKKQIGTTFQQLNEYTLVPFVNGRGEQFEIKKDGKFVGVVIIYNEAITRYKKVKYSDVTQGNVNCFAFTAFKECCERLILPKNILRYLEYRAEKLTVDKVYNIDEEELLDEFMENELKISKITSPYVSNFKWFLNEYHKRIEYGDTKEYRQILSAFLDMNHNAVDCFMQLLGMMIENVKTGIISDDCFMTPRNKEDCAFLFVSATRFDKEYYSRLAQVFMYKSKSNYCVVCVAYMDNDNSDEFHLDWLYREEQWEYDSVLEELCGTEGFKNKWQSQGRC